MSHEMNEFVKRFNERSRWKLPVEVQFWTDDQHRTLIRKPIGTCTLQDIIAAINWIEGERSELAEQREALGDLAETAFNFPPAKDVTVQTALFDKNVERFGGNGRLRANLAAEYVDDLPF